MENAKEMLGLGEKTGFCAIQKWFDDEKNMVAQYGDFMTYLRTFKGKECKLGE